MNKKSTHKTTIQKIGIGLFVFALIVFGCSLTMSRYVLDTDALKDALNNDYHESMLEKRLDRMRGEEYPSSFAFLDALDRMMVSVQEDIKKDLRENKGLTSKDSEYRKLLLQDYKRKELRLSVTKASSTGFLPENTGLIFFLSILLGVFGALLYLFPQARLLPGIKNNHIYHSTMHNRGWLGIATGIFLIGFYVLLYFFPEHMVNWILLVDPVSMALSGNPASQWFLYGFLYTLAILVMGIRMILKYRHNRYQMVRTGSVMFFQLAFAFLIPEILVRLNQPYFDFKNIWPLDYDFFFEWNLNTLIASGGLGMFMLVWGIALIVIGVPLITYFYGKRWYCSWVCGCGGLAETLGDPYRQLSDKSLPAWQIERYMIHGVLVFAVVMTGLVLYSYFSGNTPSIRINRWLFVGMIWGVGALLLISQRRFYPEVPVRKMVALVGIVGGVLTVVVLYAYFDQGSMMFRLSTGEVRKWYGFYIGSMFSGVIGTGFYPLMGNRVWCRFGCPLAAYLGLVQRFRSRFRITVNGGQCISCGNCSTYCEMGIDVRWYAQRGQDVVRSSCVGCGICAAVCPRGVLRLENASEDISMRAGEQRAILITEEKIALLS